MSRCNCLTYGFLATLLLAVTAVNCSQYSSNMFLNGEYQNGLSSRLNDYEHRPSNSAAKFISLISKRASPFVGQQYLPSLLECRGRGQQCVPKDQCVNGYFTQQLPKVQTCAPEDNVCCTYNAPTPPPTTQKPYLTCSNNMACVAARDCRNGEILSNAVVNLENKKCYEPSVCCAVPSTMLTEDGYVLKTPPSPFTYPQTSPNIPTAVNKDYLPPQPASPTRRPQPQPRPQAPAQQRPQPRPQPQPTQPRPQPEPLQPQPRPQPAQRQPRPQPQQPQPRPQPQQTQPRPQAPTYTNEVNSKPQTPSTANQYLPPAKTQYSPPPPQATQPSRPQYTPPAPKPPQPAKPQYNPPAPAPQPQQPTRPQYNPPAPAPQQPARPQYNPPPPAPQPQQPARPQYNPPASQPSQPARPQYTPPQAANNQYLPPVPSPHTPARQPQIPATQQPPRRPPPTTPAKYLPPEHDVQPSIEDKEVFTPKPLRGEDQLSPQIFPQPKPQFQEQAVRTPAKCASALLCTAENYCSSIGVISENPVQITSFRVPLTDCIIEESGEPGKCCRDPNYVDPWPVNLAGVCATRNKNTKPQGIKDLDTNFAEIPWQAMVLKESSKTLLCGGAIIGDGVVLTTASCVQDVSPNDIRVKGGEWELGSTNEPLNFQLVGVKTVAIHPSFDASTGSNDMAVLHLNERLQFASHIQPICISDKDPSPSENCITTGWGKQALSIHEEGAIMHVTTTKAVSRSDCGADSSGVCSTTNFDACEFDSGSALACGTGSNVLLKGIYSVENACGEGQAVRFIKPDVAWVNMQFLERSKPLLLRV